MLYSGDQLVLFFGSNSWSYTKLGHSNGLSPDTLLILTGCLYNLKQSAKTAQQA